MNNDIYWIWLSEIKNVGPKIGRKLLNKFNNAENIFKANYDELISIDGIGEKTANLILDTKDGVMKKAEVIMKKCVSKGIKILKINDSLYPKEVKDCADTPIIIYYLGNIRKESMGIGIVGSRRCTDYGKKVSKEIAQFLVQNNIPVISGMAKGIDGYAHTSCLNVGGYTIAVLGCGVDMAYPKEHKILMEKIIETGAVISQFPPGIKPNRLNFPKRNKLIAAFSRKLLVVEAGRNSALLGNFLNFSKAIRIARIHGPTARVSDT